MESNQHLKLNEIHCELIAEYLRFCKYQVRQRIKSIDYCFSSLLNCRVRSTETYTGDEVKGLLTDLQDVVVGEVDSELTDGVHTNTLFVQQLLSQAEEWHLTLTANVSQLEDRDKLNNIRIFDEEQQKSSDPQKMNITVTQAKQIIPVEDMNLVGALKIEIARLTSDNDSLRGKLNHEQTTNANSNLVGNEDLGKLNLELEKAQAEIRRLSLSTSQALKPDSDSLEKLQIVQEAVDTLSKELETSKLKAEEEKEKLRHDLETRESKLRQVQTNLLLAEKELDKKFQATSAYVNMKKILLQKNNKIKSLRQKLSSLGELDDDGKEEEPGEEKKTEISDPVNEEEGFRI